MPRRYFSFFFSSLITIVCLAGCTPRSDTLRPDRINGHPNINGIWQAMNTANWDIEGGSAQDFEKFWQLGALFARPAGQSVVEEGTLPYTPSGLRERERNLAGWPKSDPEAKCYRVGIPRQNYLPYPFEIVQGDGDMLFVYSYATSNRPILMKNHVDPDEVLIDQYLGWNNGHWEGDTLVIEVFGMNPSWLDRSGNHHSGTVTERYTPMGENHLWYEATINDPLNYSRPFTISMPLYRKMEPDAELFEYKCVEFSEILLYGDVLKEPITE